jgi:hypothetical protein
MGNGDIGLRFNVDVSQAKGQVEDFSNVIASLNEELKKAAEEKDWKSVAMLTQSLENTTSSRQRVMSQANQAQSEIARQNMKNGFFGGQEAWILQNALNQISRGIISTMEAAASAARMRASGDLTGAAVAEKRATGEFAGQSIGMGAGVGIGAIISAITKIPPQITIPITTSIGQAFGQFFGGGEARKMEEDLAYSQNYKNAFPSIDLLNQYFGGAINNKTPGENNQQGLQMYGRAGAAANGTGLSTQQFIEAMKQAGTAGVRSESQALNMTRTQALWARFTGTDLSAIQRYSGQAYRYGGESAGTTAATAYGGLMSQGMAKGQFGEFLNAMERILEEGIAKGFVRSSEEIAGNMTMLYKLSGGSSLWQGEQGAQRLSQMNTTIANATNLQSVEDVVSFGVARNILTRQSDGGRVLLEGTESEKRAGKGRGGVYTGGTYVDAMQLLERGVSADLLRGQFEAVSRLEGNNTAGIIERFMQMYGLNYTGGAQVWAMMERGRDSETGEFTFNAAQYEKDIRALRENPKYQSDSEKLQNTLNTLNNSLVNIGKIKFDLTEYPILIKQAQDVELIRMKLTGDPGTKPPAEAPALPTSSNSQPPVPTSMGGGPRGALALFQPGENYSAYMASGMTQFERNWNSMLRYYDSKGDKDPGKIMLGRLGTALDSVDLNNVPASFERPIGISLESFTVDFAKAMSWGISDSEYRKINPGLEQLIGILETLARQQSAGQTVNVYVDD